MITLDLIDVDGVLVGAAAVDEGFAASSFGFIRAVAQAKGFDVVQGYADTDHPSMNVYVGQDWVNFVRLMSLSSDSATLSARGAAGQGTSGSVCSSTLYWQVGRTSDGLPICLYWPNLAVGAGALLVVKLLGAGWLLSIGAGALSLLAASYFSTRDTLGGGRS